MSEEARWGMEKISRLLVLIHGFNKFSIAPFRQRSLRHKKSPSKRKGFVIQLDWIKLELVEQI